MLQTTIMNIKIELSIFIYQINFLKSYKKRINILDVGCGAGHFLKVCELKNIS